MKVHVSRNFFGAQIASFEQQLPAHEQLQRFGGGATYRAIFIRAPTIMSADADVVTVLSEYTLPAADQQRLGAEKVVVAAKQDNMLATSFHPELTEDTRWCAVGPPVQRVACSASCCGVRQSHCPGRRDYKTCTHDVACAGTSCSWTW